MVKYMFSQHDGTFTCLHRLLDQVPILIVLRMHRHIYFVLLLYIFTNVT